MSKCYELKIGANIINLTEAQLKLANKIISTHEFPKNLEDLYLKYIDFFYIDCKRCNTMYIVTKIDNVFFCLREANFKNVFFCLREANFKKVEYNTCDENIIKNLIE